MLETYDELDESTRFAALPAARDPLDPVNVYVNAVRASVSNELRCRIDGGPADWVCHALHAAVSGGPMDYGFSRVPLNLHGKLHIVISDVGVAVSSPMMDDVPLVSLEEAESHSLLSSRPGESFDKWGKLKRLAHDDLDLLIDRMRTEMGAATQDWPNMNMKGWERRKETVELVVHWLVGRQMLFSSDRPNSHNLLLDLGLDQPGPAEKDLKFRD